MRLPKTKFKLGQTVWFINRPREIESARVSLIHFALTTGASGAELFYTGLYQLENCFRPGTLNSDFPEAEIYSTRERAQKDAEWFPVSGLSKCQWLEIVGNREDSDSLENCELASCCANISNVRDLLLKCQRNSGLIKRDIRYIGTLLRAGGHDNILKIKGHPRPLLEKVFGQLQLKL